MAALSAVSSWSFLNSDRSSCINCLVAACEVLTIVIILSSFSAVNCINAVVEAELVTGTAVTVLGIVLAGTEVTAGLMTVTVTPVVDAIARTKK